MHYVFPPAFWLPALRAALLPLVVLTVLALMALHGTLPAFGHIKEGLEVVGMLASVFVALRGRG